MSESGKYDDIINLGHPTSKKHPRMPVRDRAAQFAPFSALTGLENEMAEAGRLTDLDADLTEEEIARLDQTLRQAMEEQKQVTLTFFVPDQRKTGGAFQSATGYIKKADPLEGLLLHSGVCIPMWAIRSVQIG